MDSINSQVHELISQGIEEIKEHLTTHGDINDLFARDILWTAVYFNGGGDAFNASYDNIYIDTEGELFIELADGVTLYEEDLSPNHVLDILSLIEEINENK